MYTQNGGHLLSDVAGYFRGGDAVAAPTPPAGTPGALLARLTVAPQDFNVGYHREDWGYPADVDGDCQDTRAEVLIRDVVSSLVLTKSGCTVASGVWTDSYSGIAFPSPTLLEIDHVVPLAVAHRSGGALWSPATKALFANDTAGLELRAVGTAQNQAKGDSTPDQWLPPLVGARCGYVTAWVTVKAQWQLTVTQAEHDTLAGILAGC